MWSISKKILYNIGLIYILTQLKSVIDIKSNDDLVVFYTWILLLFNTVLFFFNHKFKRIVTLVLLSIFPFILSGVLTNLTGNESVNLYNFYYTNGSFIFEPYWLHIIVSTLIVMCIKFGNRSFKNTYSNEIVDMY